MPNSLRIYVTINEYLIFYEFANKSLIIRIRKFGLDSLFVDYSNSSPLYIQTLTPIVP